MLAERDTNAVFGWNKMIDAAAEHDQPDALAHLDSIVRAYAAHDSPCEVARDLHDAVAPSGGVAKDHQVALVVCVRIVTKSGAKFARRMLDHRNFAADRRAVHMNIER